MNNALLKAVEGRLICDYGLHLPPRDLRILADRYNIGPKPSEIAWRVANAWQRGERAI